MLRVRQGIPSVRTREAGEILFRSMPRESVQGKEERWRVIAETRKTKHETKAQDSREDGA